MTTLQNSPTTAFDDEAFAELRSLLPGQVLLPADEGWDQGRLGWTVSVDQRPAAVVTVDSGRDVAAVVRWAARHGGRVSVQPVGHGATRALDDTVLLRTGALQDVFVDASARTATVGAGVKWGTLLAAVEPTGLVALAGSNPDPSVVGYTLGGGVSWFSRAFGLAAHQVVAFELVDAAGDLRRVTRDSDPDLFWALCGGGGGLGIVTALQIRLHEAAPVHGGRLMWPVEMARPVLRAFRAIAETAPEELTMWAQVFRFPPLPDVPEELRGKAFVSVDVAFLGPETEANRLLSGLRQLPALAMDYLGPVPLGDLGSIAAEPRDPMPTIERSVLLHDLDEASIDRLLDVVGAGTDVPLAVVQLRHLGGALARATDADGPAGAVSEGYSLFALGVPVFPGAQEAITGTMDAVWAALAPQVSGRTLFNFLGAGADPTSAFTPAALDRLRAVKQDVDPAGVFQGHRPVV